MNPSLSRFGAHACLALLASFLHAFLAAAAPAQPPPAVTVSAVPDRQALRPGEQFVIAVIFDHEPGWHSHTNNPIIPASWGDFTAIKTEIDVIEPPRGLIIGPTQWPQPYTIELDLGGTGVPEPYAVFDGKAIAFVPFMLNADYPEGPLTITIKTAAQACDDTTCRNVQLDVHTITLPVSATASPGQPADPSIFKGFDVGVYAKMLSGTTAASLVNFNVFGRSFTIDTAGLGIILLLLLALLGGAVLNMTPCVLPVIPIKVMSLSAAAGNPGRCALLGTIMSLGVVFFWLVLGAAIATITQFKAINQLFQYPAFSITVGVFIAVMGVGMLGLFSVRLPQFVYMLDPKHDSAAGSFFFGILTAILSTPCTAPFMGTAAAWAAKQPHATTLAVFAAIGIGMALPYFILSLNPRLVSRVPRTGPASELVKQVMGLLMIAVAVFFLGVGIDPLLRIPVDPPIRAHWWAIAAIVAFAMGLLIYKTFAITKRPAPRLVWSVIGLAFFGITLSVVISVTDRGPVKWIGYTPDRLAAAKANGDVVVIDFTAEWCLTCKALEAGVLHRESVFTILNSPGVSPLKVDLTGNNELGKAKLDSYNWIGIPLLVIDGPGLDEPILYDTYTVDSVLSAIEKARGKPVAGNDQGTPPRP